MLIQRTLPLALLVIALVGPAPARGQDEKPKTEAAPKTEDQPKTESKPASPEKPKAADRPYVQQLQRLKDALGLTDDQLAKIKAIFAETREGIEKLRDDAQAGNIQPEEAREKARELREKTGDKIREVLDAEQAQKYDVIRERLRENDPNAGDTYQASVDRAKRILVMQNVEKALDDMKDDEKKTVVAAVQKLLEVRARVDAAAAKRRTELQGLATDKIEKTELSSKLSAFRAAQDADRERVKKAETAVRDLLSVAQEVKLVALGVLD